LLLSVFKTCSWLSNKSNWFLIDDAVLLLKLSKPSLFT
jgi:hypothetical protein